MPIAETESPAKTAESTAATRPPREKDRVDSFARRHIGPNKEARDAMLSELGFANLDELIDATVPQNIRLDRPLGLPDAKSESEALKELLKEFGGTKAAKSTTAARCMFPVTPAWKSTAR